MRHNQGQNQKRSRGRGRRNSNHGQTNFNRNTTFDSNGPEGRLRGNALQLFEKYTALAHDANAAGERISAEALAQFADHYYRIHQSIVQAAEQHRRSHEERQQARKSDESASVRERRIGVEMMSWKWRSATVEKRSVTHGVRVKELSLVCDVELINSMQRSKKKSLSAPKCIYQISHGFLAIRANVKRT